MFGRYWNDILHDPLSGREEKPRCRGLTMVIDSGVGLRLLEDTLDSAGEWIDFWKFGFGTSYLHPPQLLKAKLALLEQRGVLAYPGGTLFEAAILQGRGEEFLQTVRQLGFRGIEISDGTISLAPDERRHWIRAAKGCGFVVLAETGKKRAGLAMKVEEYARQLEQDLEDGADYVIVEGRESGRNVGFYREDGSIREAELNALLQNLKEADRILWEAPQKQQQEFFLRRLGLRVNLGNIHPADVLALETLRRGLRSDTLRWTFENREQPALAAFGPVQF
ncbi:MAG: phosphosulfolactate synthase [Alicyclobacillaceae bacterium]|nr:phosphosulfolactate synthase [Alicyclobacillaceae bacterium]